MNVVSENAGPVALLEATAEARALIEELTRLAEELKSRQERLGELLAPSEAALRARTEYLDNLMRDELSRAEQRVLKLGEEVERIVRPLSDHVVQISAQLAEADARRWSETRRRERWRTVVSLLAMLLGGFLTGQVASYRSGGTANAKPAVVAETKPRSKNAPSAPRRPGGPSAKPNAATALLSREEIARSVELQRRHGQEYVSMLRVIPDRELAKAAARLNVSALLLGHPRIVPSERSLSVERIRGVLTRGGEDVDEIRHIVSRLLERSAPAIERPPPRVRDLGPER